MYADETGDLDTSGSTGTSTYFGFGTSVFAGEHGHALWQGLQLRCMLEQRGVKLPKGFHAKNDSHATRDEVFAVIGAQTPRFDTTFLLKSNAFPRVKDAGKLRLYKLAWFQHFRKIITEVSAPGDTVYVIAATLNVKSKLESAHTALDDVCSQFANDRTITLCVWDAPSSWGVQVADYGLWATQRVLENRECSWYESFVLPTLKSLNTPWGKA